MQRKNIPDLSFEFALNQINLTLINDISDYKGVTLSAHELTVKLNKYDATNKFNPKSIDIDISLQNYGLWVVQKCEDTGEIDYSPFMQKLLKQQEDEQKESNMQIQVLEEQPQQPPVDGNESDSFVDCRDEEESKEQS